MIRQIPRSFLGSTSGSARAPPRPKAARPRHTFNTHRRIPIPHHWGHTLRNIIRRGGRARPPTMSSSDKRIRPVSWVRKYDQPPKAKGFVNAAIIGATTICVWGLSKIKKLYVEGQLAKARRALYAKMRQPLLERGVTREFCEAKIEELEELVESELASVHERYKLSVYKRWHNLLTRGLP